jgi:hypothetical protein
MVRKHTKDEAKVGLGIGLAAAAIAGAYYLYGSKEGAKRRAKIRGWSLRVKGEVLEKLENMKEVDEEAYNKVVDTVTDKYKKVKGVDISEISLLAQDLKKHWGNIKRQLQAGSKPAKKSSSKKPARKKSSRSKGGSSSAGE